MLSYALLNALQINDVTVKTGTGNVTMVSEGVVVVNKTSGAATTVTLPPHECADNLGCTFRWIVDGKGDAATNNITVVPEGSDTINGGSSYVISENYGSALFMLRNGGTDWLLVGTATAVSAAELGFLNGVTAGTAAASKAVVLDSSLNVGTVNSFTANSMTLASVASVNAAGSVIGNATALTGTVNLVAGADDAKGVILPTNVIGKPVFVYSSQGTNGLKVYPPVNGTINDGSANAAIVIEGKSLALFIATNSVNYSAIFTVNS